jgi:hypothetical protein
MNVESLKEIIRRELPGLLQTDPELQETIRNMSQDKYADKRETESRFDRLLDELRREREESSRKWDEMTREQNSKWEEQNRKWEEQNRKWEENQQEIRALVQSVERLSYKHDATIGALGARWGLQTEQSFRNALKGILEEFFDVQVVNVIEYDDTGQVFGRPDQVELDLIIKDGLLIIAEIKSSMSKSDMHIFFRKVKFYEQQHERQAARMLVISPMVDHKAQEVATSLGIQVYSHAQDVDPSVFT